MLVARRCEIGLNTRFTNKLEALQKPSSLRMSNFDQLSTQPDWREQYSVFSPPEENGLDALFETHTSSNIPSTAQNKGETRLNQEQQLSPNPLTEEQYVIQDVEKSQWHPKDYENSKTFRTRDSFSSRESPTTPSVPIKSAPLISNAPTLANKDGVDVLEIKDEGGSGMGDDEMADAETESAALSQTAAQRRAERRKMKRFRLTHQQTRFLMSEFAKHAHPDAAHREKLSKEIPGLSPRQVQVWFQNRRAKIKRLTADDRERIIKMRAVPDEFDNVQALHSSYGAVHGIRAPLQSPINFIPTYSESLIRPTMIDRTRGNGESLATLSPNFDYVGFNPRALSGAGIISPATLTSPENYHGSHISSPQSVGPQSPNSYTRQNNYASHGHGHQSHSRHTAGSLQTPQYHEAMSESRPEPLQSPMMLGASWKSKTVDYAKYQVGILSPRLGGQQLSTNQTGFSSDSGVNALHYDPNTYSSTSNVGSSPTSLHPSSATSLMEQADMNPSASPSTFRCTLDPRNQYRGHHLPQQVDRSRGRSFGNTFTSGYVNAPPTYLSSPQDFIANNSTPVAVGQGGRDFDFQSQNVEG